MHVAHVLGLCGPRGAALNHLDPVVSLARRPCNVITKEGFIVTHWLLLLQEGTLSPLTSQSNDSFQKDLRIYLIPES